MRWKYTCFWRTILKSLFTNQCLKPLFVFFLPLLSTFFDKFWTYYNSSKFFFLREKWAKIWEKIKRWHIIIRTNESNVNLNIVLNKNTQSTKLCYFFTSYTSAIVIAAMLTLNTRSSIILHGWAKLACNYINLKLLSLK